MLLLDCLVTLFKLELLYVTEIGKEAELIRCY